MPVTPGTHSAILKETFNVNGAITGADISKDNINEIVLIGYHPTNGNLFMWLLFDYQTEQVFSGNKRRIELGSALNYGQIEGVTYIGGGVGYISSERFRIFTINVPASLYTFTSLNWAPLPVELINFKVLNTGKDVHIAWQTATETDTDYFALERSMDGVAFNEIYRQSAAGLSRSLRTYNYTDRYSISGTSYYRLRQVDLNGKFTFSAIQVVQSGNMPILGVSPIPARRGEDLKIRFTGLLGNLQLCVRSTDGYIHIQQHISSAHKGLYSLSTDSLQPGIYFLQITSSSTTLNKKIVIL
jgi:hypothetical protein